MTAAELEDDLPPRPSRLDRLRELAERPAPPPPPPLIGAPRRAANQEDEMPNDEAPACKRCGETMTKKPGGKRFVCKPCRKGVGPGSAGTKAAPPARPPALSRAKSKPAGGSFDDAIEELREAKARFDAAKRRLAELLET